MTITLYLDGAGSDNNYGTYYEMRQIIDGVTVVLKGGNVGVGSSAVTLTYTVDDQLFYFGGNDQFQIYETQVNSSASGTHSWSVVLDAEGPFDNGTYA